MHFGCATILLLAQDLGSLCNLLGGRLPVELNLYDVVIPEQQIAVHDTVTLMDLVDDQSHAWLVIYYKTGTFWVVFPST